MNHADYYIARLERGIFFPAFDDVEQMLKLCGSSFAELHYEPFEDYADDMELLARLKKVDGRMKDLVVSLLIMKYNEQKDAEKISTVG